MLFSNGAHVSNRFKNGVVSFVLPLHDTIYAFDGETIQPAYVLDFQEESVPPAKLKQMSGRPRDARRMNQKILEGLFDNYAVGYLIFIELEGWLYFDYFYKHKGRGVFYNKKNEKVHNLAKIPYNKVGWETFFPIKFGGHNCFYSAIDPVTIERLLQTNKKLYSGERIASIENLLNTIKAESNPIIIKYELNRFGKL